MRFIEQGHLGGYIAGGDDATFFPDLWRWLVEEYGVRSVVDVGCGEGHSLRFFRDLDCAVVGIDGVAQDDPDIFAWDYTAGPFVRKRMVFDEETQIMGAEPLHFALCWSCEFVEHVEERYVPNFLATFACADLVLMTHAEPGQAGYHHVNCQPAAYWIGAMAAIGYSISWDLTMLCRTMAMKNENPHNHFARSGLAFRRSG